MATTLLVFDPALCCSSGVCGPEVDPELVRFAADVDWLKRQGVEVHRFNLAQDANTFATHATVRTTLQQEGVECLPLVLHGDEIVSRGAYPERAELARLASLGGQEIRSRQQPASVRALPVQGCEPGSDCC